MAGGEAWRFDFGLQWTHLNFYWIETNISNRSWCTYFFTVLFLLFMTIFLRKHTYFQIKFLLIKFKNKTVYIKIVSKLNNFKTNRNIGNLYINKKCICKLQIQSGESREHFGNLII